MRIIPTVIAALLVGGAANGQSADDEEPAWICVPTEDRGWRCGRGANAPDQTALPPPPPTPPPPAGYTAPGGTAPLPAYLQTPPADATTAETPVEEAAAAADDEPETREPGQLDAPDVGRQPDVVQPVAPAAGPVYGIQLVSVRDPESLDGFAERHGLDPDSVYRRQWQDDSGTWHVLLSGRFGTVAAAQRALESLPAPLREGGAWIRRVDTLSSTDTE